MPAGQPRAVVVVGNPRPASRTAAVGRAVAQAALAYATAAGDGVDQEAFAQERVELIDLADLAPRLFDWKDPQVAAAKELVLSADLVVVASPVYKASLTGLLKAFLDRFGRDELDGVATVPVMVGAGAQHALAVEWALRPVLVELGGSCPTRGVYVLEQTLDTLDEQLQEWLRVAGRPLAAVIAARSGRPAPTG
jgi:FMN reductase